MQAKKLGNFFVAVQFFLVRVTHGKFDLGIGELEIGESRNICFASKIYIETK